MSFAIVPYTQDRSPAVLAMNQRLKDGGSGWAFYRDAIPKWLPHPDDGGCATVWQEYYLAVDGEDVRGGYVLKPQVFAHNGASTTFVSWQGPVSEGLIDNEFAAVGMLCLRDMAQKQPNLFCWGGSEKLLALVAAFGWARRDTPQQIAVVDAGRFLRHAKVLRKTARRARLLDMAAITGLGAAALAIWRLTTARPRRTISATHVPKLSAEADTLWEQAKGTYGTIAVRDATAVNALLAGDYWPNVKIIEVRDQGALIGWGAISTTQHSDDSRFGNMMVGAILDALALPGQEADVLAVLYQSLIGHQPDMVMTHMTHTLWRAALKRNGFLELAHRKAFCAAPRLVKVIGDDLDSFLGSAHLTPIDADGPHGL